MNPLGPNSCCDCCGGVGPPPRQNVLLLRSALGKPWGQIREGRFRKHKIRKFGRSPQRSRFRAEANMSTLWPEMGACPTHTSAPTFKPKQPELLRVPRWADVSHYSVLEVLSIFHGWKLCSHMAAGQLPYSNASAPAQSHLQALTFRLGALIR